MAENTPMAARPVGEPQTDFILPVYFDATLAGLAVLIPLPFVDAIIERYFSRRMVRDIAAYNHKTVSNTTILILNRRESNWLAGCLMLPVRLITYLLKDLLRTLLYALTVADAAERLGQYWHRAFLTNYAMQQGHLEPPAHPQVAAAAIQATIDGVTASPLLQLAQEIVAQGRARFTNVLTFVRLARRKGDQAQVEATAKRIATAWSNYSGYWLSVAARYDAIYASLLARQRAAAQTTAVRP